MTLAVTVVCRDGAVVVAEVAPPGVAALGFLVDGYDDAGVGEAWEVTLPEWAVEPIATTANGGGAA